MDIEVIACVLLFGPEKRILCLKRAGPKGQWTTPGCLRDSVPGGEHPLERHWNMIRYETGGAVDISRMELDVDYQQHPPVWILNQGEGPLSGRTIRTYIYTMHIFKMPTSNIVPPSKYSHATLVSIPDMWIYVNRCYPSLSMEAQRDAFCELKFAMYYQEAMQSTHTIGDGIHVILAAHRNRTGRAGTGLTSYCYRAIAACGTYIFGNYSFVRE